MARVIAAINAQGIIDNVLTDGRVLKIPHFLEKPVQSQKQMSMVSMGKLFRNGLNIVHENEPNRDSDLLYIVVPIGVTTSINPSVAIKTCSR